MTTKVDLHGMTRINYIYCEDCDEYVDFFKYDHDIEAAGHLGCNWRYVNDVELEECVKDCLEPIVHCPHCQCLIDIEPEEFIVCPECRTFVPVPSVSNCFDD